MTTHKILVSPEHSSVLGYGAWAAYGRELWDTLDWRAVRTDGGRHMLNPDGGDYLHVRVKAEDWYEWWRLAGRRWYRVRCRYRIGLRWRGGVVTDVRVAKEGKKWYWFVDVDDD